MEAGLPRDQVGIRHAALASGGTETTMPTTPRSCLRFLRPLRLGVSILATLAAIGGRARAQEAPRREHVLGVGLGYGRFATVDQAASPLVYGANAGVGALEYQGEAGAVRFGVRTSVAYGADAAIGFERTIRFREVELDGTVTETDVPMRGNRLAGSAEAFAGYLHRLERVDVYVGASLEYAVVRPQGFVAPGLMQRVVTGPAVALRWRLGTRQRLEFEARTSLSGWSTRLPYHQSVSWPGSTAYQGLVRQGSHGRTLVSQRTLELVASHRLRLREHLALRSAVYVSYLSDDDPRPLRALSSRFVLFLDTVF